MNKMYKVLATASILALAAMPVAANAQQLPAQAVQKGNANKQTDVKNVPATWGQITNFVHDKSDKFITVTGRGLAPTDQDEIVLAITPKTKFIDAKGKTVPLQKIIDGHKTVKAFYSPNITKSIPARGTALTLVVQDQSFSAIDGKVTEVRDGRILVKGTDVYDKHDEEIWLHFADKATIIDQNRKTIAAGDIKEGMSVRAFYGPAVAMSLPPQSGTNYVIVNTNMEDVNPGEVNELTAGTAGVITDQKDGQITVIGQPLEKGGVNYVVLSIDDKTQIVDEDGNKLTKDALKTSGHVEATYGAVMTLMYPAHTHADKIVVKKAESVKIEGTVMPSDRTSKDQVYVNVGSDDSTANDVILNISKETTIIPALGGDTALRAGTKIVAFHSPVMTKSLPGITSAEVVIVTSDKDAVQPK
ncbi:peptidase [Paenibacillus cookii]|uniref:Peptidase n=1 Tax=Paenibacillus cookii TaxID=157839 RepID=A0ABQ4LV16_9BACL|nr:peptidase [Paenibacillus cookii]GIO66601.1 hypothetical protein J21TS3_14220 [Paenibacillus cookii]